MLRLRRGGGDDPPESRKPPWGAGRGFCIHLVVLFFLGYLLGALAWGRGALAGCLAFVIGICLAVVYDRKVVRKEKTGYTITGFAGETLLKLNKKGDNEL